MPDPVTEIKAQSIERIHYVRSVWAHDLPDGVDWTSALSRDYWVNVVERFRPGDRVEVHSYDHCIQFTMHIIDVNTASDPIYLDAVFLPVYPTDLQLPTLPPQTVPRYAVRQAPGSSNFNVVDTSTGRPVHENPKGRYAAQELAAEMERALAFSHKQAEEARTRRSKRPHLARQEELAR